jgi:hypothetical protein
VTCFASLGGFGDDGMVSCRFSRSLTTVGVTGDAETDEGTMSFLLVLVIGVVGLSVGSRSEKLLLLVGFEGLKGTTPVDCIGSITVRERLMGGVECVGTA